MSQASAMWCQRKRMARPTARNIAPISGLARSARRRSRSPRSCAVAQRKDHRADPGGEGGHDCARPAEALPLAGKADRAAKGGADAGAPDRAEEDTGKHLPAKAGPVDPVDPGIGAGGETGGDGGEAGIQAGDQEDQAEADHQHGAGLCQAAFVKADGLTESGDREAEGDKADRHAARHGQRSKPMRLQGRGQHYRQHRQDAGVDQGQKPGKICKDKVHGMTLPCEPVTVTQTFRWPV